MSYGTSISDASVGHIRGPHSQGRQAGRPARDAGVEVEFVINATTARLLDISIPPALLAIADEVIE